MGKRMQETVRMMLALFFYLSSIAFVRARLHRRKGPLVRVLLIHHIKDAGNFERMIRFLASHYHAISFDDLVAKRFSGEKINILLSFDDGYASWFHRGLPILEKYNAPALFFLSSGFVEPNEPNTLKKFLNENPQLSFCSEPLTWKMAQKSAEHPLIEIGGHSRTHPFLTKLPEHKIQEEIAEDKKILEQRLGHPIRVFAYPFGDYNDTVRRVAGTEYPYAVTTNGNFYSPDGDSLAIPRSNHGTVSNAVLGMWVLGAFDLADRTIASMRSLIGYANSLTI